MSFLSRLYNRIYDYFKDTFNDGQEDCFSCDDTYMIDLLKEEDD